MSGHSAPVQEIRFESITVEADFPVTLGELVRTEDGRWYGLVQSQSRSAVRVLPLDPPEELSAGTQLTFTGRTATSKAAGVSFGSVVDPLGRSFYNLPVSSGPAQKPPTEDFFGLGNLGDTMVLHRSEGVALLGSPPGGFPSLFSQIAAAQQADHLYILCQGSVRELRAYCDAVQFAGNSGNTLIIWTPPWQQTALRNMAPQFLTALVNDHPVPGDSLILIDDLHHWLNGVREYGETLGEILLSDGFPSSTRRQFAELLDLKSSSGEGESTTSLIVGWRFDEAYSPLVEHPYMARLPRFLKTGFFLDEHSEYLVPSPDSWGELSPLGRAWRKLCAIESDSGEELRPVLSLLQHIFAQLFIEYQPLRAPYPYGMDERPQFTASDEPLLIGLARSLRPADAEQLLRLRAELNLHFREPPRAQRQIFLDYLRKDSKEKRA